MRKRRAKATISATSAICASSAPTTPPGALRGTWTLSSRRSLKLRKCTGRPGALPEANMLTIFSTPKPFRGHIGITQRNALRSWTLLHPEVEIILFGDEAGAAEVCAEFGLRHEPC